MKLRTVRRIEAVLVGGLLLDFLAVWLGGDHVDRDLCEVFMFLLVIAGWAIDTIFYRCPNCNRRLGIFVRYCPHCGERIDLDVK